MVPIKCVFLFPNAAMFRGFSGKTRGVNIKASIDTLYRLKGTFFHLFLGKNVHLGPELTKSLSSVRLLGMVRSRSRVKGK